MSSRASLSRLGLVALVLWVFLFASAVGPVLATSPAPFPPGKLTQSASESLGGAGPMVPTPSSATEYNVTFTEEGLPPTTAWEVDTTTPVTGFGVENASATTTVSEWWPNGTYTYTVSADLSNYTSPEVNSTFTVSGSGLSVPVLFYPAYPVRFTETGLLNYTPWRVSVEGNATWANLTWSGSTITLLVPVGPFAYTVTAEGYNATPANGSASGSGPVQFSITFTKGLPIPGFLTGDVNVGSAAFYLNGYRFYIQVGGGYFFTLEPGLYSIIVTAAGYITYYNATFITSGNTTYLDIPLAGIPTPVIPNTSIPGIDLVGWLLIGGLAVGCFVLAGVAVLFMRRAGRRPPSSVWVQPIESAKDSHLGSPPGPGP
jgi:hypothetical protein